MKAAKEPLTAVVEARELTVGDWVEPEGIVRKLNPGQAIVVTFRSGYKIYNPEEIVMVRLEDHGEKEGEKVVATDE